MLLLFILYLIEVKDVNHVATVTGSGEIVRESFSKIAASEIIQIIIKHGPDMVSDDAFRSCTSLQILNVSFSILDIPSKAFDGLKNTLAINVPLDHPTLSTDDQGALYNKNKTVLIHAPKKLSSYIIPETVEILKTVCCSECRFVSLRIPSKVIIIEKYAFNHLFLEKALTFAQAVDELLSLTIGNCAFQYGNIPEVHISASCTFIDSTAFIKSNINKIVFDDYNQSKLTTLKNSCFCGFKGKSVKLPPKLKGIPSNCFQDSPNLEEVYIPRDCASIDATAFSGCPKLSKMIVDPSNLNFTDDKGSIFNKQKTALFFVPPTTQVLVLPAELEKIGAGILHSLKQLTEVDTNHNDHFYFEGGVLYDADRQLVIGACGGVEEFTILDSATSIAASAFAFSSFKRIIINKGSLLDTIGSNAFQSNTAIQSIYLPGRIRKIGSSSFFGCKSLSEVEIEPDCPLSTIESSCFESTAITRITIPRNVNKIQYRGIAYCWDLERITLIENNSLQVLESDAVRGCYKLQTITNPSNITKIMSDAFRECPQLQFPFHQAVKLTDIEVSAFRDSGNIEINLSSSIKNLQEMIFQSNTKLEIVRFAEEIIITSLPGSIFVNCTRLQHVVLSKNIKDLSYSVFRQCTSLIDIDCSKSNYLKNIEGIIYKDSELADSLILVLCPPGRKQAIVNDKTEDLKENCFRECELLTKITFKLPSQLKNIDPYTFSKCTKLSDIILPQSVLTVGSNAFADCISLESIPFPDECNISSIPTECFSNIGVRKIIIPDSIRKVGSKSFSNCRESKEVIIKDTVELIESGAFSNCPNLRTIKYCGKKEIRNEDIVNDPLFIIDVSIFYETIKFGANSVRKSLDPNCSLITEFKDGNMNSVFLFVHLINDDENDD